MIKKRKKVLIGWVSDFKFESGFIGIKTIHIYKRKLNFEDKVRITIEEL